jgi:YkoP domain
MHYDSTISLEESMEPESRPAGRAKSYRVPRWEHWLDRTVLALGRPPWGESGSGRPRGIMHIFRFVEYVLECLHPSKPLRPGGIARYEVIRFGGAPLPLRGQPAIRKGEMVIGLHFDNRVVASMEAAESSIQILTWRMLRVGTEDFALLADLVRQGVFAPGIRAVWGETVLNRVLRRLGFHVRPAARNLRTPFARLFFLCVLAIYGRPGYFADDRTLDRLQLGEIWLSVDELLERYPAGASTVENVESRDHARHE